MTNTVYRSQSLGTFSPFSIGSHQRTINLLLATQNQKARHLRATDLYSKGLFSLWRRRDGEICGLGQCLILLCFLSAVQRTKHIAGV